MTATQVPTEPSPQKVVRRRGDVVFAGFSRGAGILILVILAGVTAFLFAEAVPALTAPASEIDGGEGLAGCIAPLLFGTLLSAVIGLLVGTPLAVAIALFISHYAPGGWRRASPTSSTCSPPSPASSTASGASSWPLGSCLNQWLERYLGCLPFFDKADVGPSHDAHRGHPAGDHDPADHHHVTREVFLQVPKMHEEAALALGATRWEVIRMSVLPFGRSGIICASMLGLGRALGETMAVAVVLSLRCLTSS